MQKHKMTIPLGVGGGEGAVNNNNQTILFRVRVGARGLINFFVSRIVAASVASQSQHYDSGCSEQSASCSFERAKGLWLAQFPFLHI